MEEENQVFGQKADAVENNNNLESEDFYFYCQNKEEAKKNIDNSIDKLTGYIDTLISDIPDPSDVEVSEGVKKILDKAHPEEQNSVIKANRVKKTALKVLFIAALLSVVSFSCLFAVGNSRNISIENGFVTFAKDTIKIVFFDETEEEFITVDALLTDLELHGYGDILFPQEFVTKSDEYKVSVPEYKDEEFKQVAFELHSINGTYFIGMHKYVQNQKSRDFDDIKATKSIKINDTYIYLFDFDTEFSAIEYSCGDYHIFIHSKAPFSEMVRIAETIN